MPDPADSAALHTLARRYLMDRYAHWVERYDEIRGGRHGAYTEPERDTYPRYNVAAAMLDAVEAIRPEDLPPLPAAREQLAAAGLHAQSIMTAGPCGDVQARAMAEERAAFAGFVRTAAEAEIAAAEPLPYRRVLAEEEVRRILVALDEQWGVKHYWFPLDDTHRTDVLALQAPYFERDVGADGLRRILAARGVARVWEIREYGPSYEMELSLLEPDYTGAEGFWCAASPEAPVFDWLVYASHESSLTFGGAWLVEQVRAVWPAWEGYVWTTPFF